MDTVLWISHMVTSTLEVHPNSDKKTTFNIGVNKTAGDSDIDTCGTSGFADPAAYIQS